MSHTALARKYRPRGFAEVTGQGHVSETLRRAITGNRVGHAYLFCGPRGVGKTTAARVLAMALNCPDRSDDGEPCGQCSSCSRIWGGHTALDVVEIDAASNRGVDDARDLRERAMYAPSGENSYKVYIVDEAHMLTREAWNALLKVLEEPPPRVIFVFATTEPQKIQQSAAPILSRCQRFDFRRIGSSDIVLRLAEVIQREGGTAPEEALRIIARKADGGMRDALSLLDQVLALGDGQVDIGVVRRVLGLVEEERYLQLLDILREGRHGDVFKLVEELTDEGYDLVEFYHGLLDTLRAVLRLRLDHDVELDLPAGLREGFADRAQSFEPGDLVRMLAAAAELEAQGSLRGSPNPRVLIEMLLLRLSYLDRTVSFEELLRALGGAAAPAGGAGSDPEGVPAKGRSTTAATAPQEPTPLGIAARLAQAGENVEASASAAGPTPAVQEIPADDIAPAPSAAEAWRRWLDAGREIPRGLSAFLRSAGVRECPDGTVEVAPLPGPAVERLADPVVLDQMRRGLAPYLGRSPQIVIKAGSGAPSAEARITEDEVRDDTLNALIRQEPRLERAVLELDLELMD